LIAYPSAKGAVTISASVTSIGASAFRECTDLTSVTIPARVKSIGESAFNGCTGLTNITIPKGITSIGNWAFSGLTASQTVNVQGKANQQAADKAWGANWRGNCKAVINYSK